MTERIIPIHHGASLRLPAWTATSGQVDVNDTSAPVLDRRQRPLRDLRLSVTDRCNFRCTYCMPREVFHDGYQFLPHAALLSFEEMLRLSRLFVDIGVEKIRLTGGEPLLRKDLQRLVAMLAELRTPQGVALDLTLTTNGSLLARKAAALREAGLRRVTVSMDALDDHIFRRMNDADFGVSEVLHGIEIALQHFDGVKVNMVVQRGVNDHQIVPMAERFRGTGVVLRFIEFMDVGQSNHWQMSQVVPSDEVLARLAQSFPLEPLPAHYAGETASRYRYLDGQGEIGLISSVTQAFCRDCTRARLSTEGRLFLCLFASRGYDLKPMLRDQPDDHQLRAILSAIWSQRDDRYSELREQIRQSAPQTDRKVEMSYIGG